MRLRLELHPDDLMAFSTISAPGVEDSYRVLVVKVGGKAFHVWRTLDLVSYGFVLDQRRYVEEVDKALVAAMEQMFNKLFQDACAAAPEGVDLLK